MNNKTEKTALQMALRSARRLFAVIGFFSFFINMLMLVGPLYMMQIYDRVLTSRSYETLLALTAVAVGLIGVGALLELVRTRLLIRLGARFDTDLGTPLFRAIFVHQLNSKSADGAQFLRDMDAIRGFFSGPALNAFFDAPWTPAFIAAVFLVHPLLGAVALIGAIILFCLALISEISTRGSQRGAVEQDLRANEFASSTLRNADVIRAMGMHPKVSKRWLGFHKQGLAWHGRASDRASLSTSAVKFIRPCLQIAMLGFGAYLVIQEAITPGVMIAASIIMGRALAPVEGAISNWRQFISARGSYNRLQKLLEAYPPEAQSLQLPEPQGRLKVHNVVARAPGGGQPLLHGINFELPPGQVLGVIGPSGAGKSTLARLLVSVWQPSSGHVRLDGAELCNWPEESFADNIGYLPQDVELLACSVAENIARLGEPDPAKVVAAAQLCGAHEMILHLPEAYDTQVGEAGCSLSGGQRQRIALARALYGTPPFIVLDEPNANLDNEGELALQDTLRQLKELRKTVVVISHRPAVLSEVDMVLVLRGGTQEKFGTREEVLSKLVSSIRPVPAASSMTRKEVLNVGTSN